MNKWVFDVDGTLTPSRGKMDEQFKSFMMEMADRNDVYIVTGSDRDKTLEQVGEDLYNRCKIVFNCSGNDIWEQDKNVFTTKWKLSEELTAVLETALEKSKYPVKTGKHIEYRPGMVNFSIVGRNATHVERKDYHNFDNQTGERKLLAKIINKTDKTITAQVAGETGIDILERKKDKRQVMDWFSKDDTVHFFGDRMEQGGNDEPLATANANGYNTTVKNWEDTYNRLILLKAIGEIK